LKTVTVKLQVAMLLDVSVAVHITVVEPTAKPDPDAGVHAAVTPGQLSVGTGNGKVTTTHGSLIVGVFAVRLGRHVIAGGAEVSS
jgi:hypothetical protein